MDMTIRSEEGIFNYRVAAVLIQDGKLLAMRDERSPYYYLPGGRVKLGEQAEQAVLREVREELGITCKISRPLWLNQGFFTEDTCGERFHELCLYFLMDHSGTDLLSRGECFRGAEKHHEQWFSWIPFGQLEHSYFYPLFLKKEIFHLPQQFTLRTEVE